jgi:hypothetical protein
MNKIKNLYLEVFLTSSILDTKLFRSRISACSSVDIENRKNFLNAIPPPYYMWLFMSSGGYIPLVLQKQDVHPKKKKKMNKKFHILLHSQGEVLFKAPAQASFCLSYGFYLPLPRAILCFLLNPAL